MEAFETYLSTCMHGVDAGVVRDACYYSLLGGGKRIRAKLLFASLTLYEVELERAYPIASAIEMIHAYSLVHDDLPAMDNDTMRRGKATTHVKYGEAMAILAGDALLNEAFYQVSTCDYEDSIKVQLLQYISSYSGLNGMIYGQELDILNEKNMQLKVDELQRIHIHKTGRLIQLPLVSAAIIAKRTEDISVLKEIGKNVGLLFQIQDDVLDVTQSSEVLGKNANSDVENEKSTYVSLLGIEKCNDIIEQLYNRSIQLINMLEGNRNALFQMLEEIKNRVK